MNVGDMITEVERLIDKEDTADFDNQAIVEFLNQAQDEYVDRKYLQFEMSQKVVDDISGLVVNDLPLATASGHYVFPADYRHLLRVYATTTDNVCNKTYTRAQMRFVQQDDYEEALHDPFENGKPSKPIYTIDALGLLVNPGANGTVTSVVLTYLKTPDLMDAGILAAIPPFPEHAQRDIVNIAVRIMLENIEQPRYQTYLREQMSQEN